MNAYAVVTRSAASAVAAVLRDKGMADTPLVAAEPGQGPAALEEAARVPADVLILDVGTGPGLGPAALRYRLARPQARVVLLAVDRQPGDAAVAQVVQSGVYDVVTDLEDLADALDRPPADLAQAALWLDPSLAPVAHQAVVKERVVERKVPMSTRPVLVMVFGAAPGAGATTVACALAAYLARLGYSTALVGADGTDSIAVAAAESPPMPPGISLPRGPRRWLPNLDYWLQSDCYDAARSGRYQYIVADRGCRPRLEVSGAVADLVIVVLPPIQRLAQAIAWKREGRDRDNNVLDRVRYVALAGPAGAKALTEAWQAIYETSNEGPPEAAVVYPLPARPETSRDWPPGYSRDDPGLHAACRAVLADVLLDDAKPRRRWPWRRPMGA